MDLTVHGASSFQAKIFRAISHVKHLRKIFGSYSFFFGVEQERRKAITEWSIQEIMDWFTKLGLSEFNNIIKYNGITGETLVAADEDYLEQTMGVMK